MLSEILERTRAARPLVHCISNYVSANDCVNLLLAGGASGIMADDPDEVEEVTAICSALVLNLGTPNPRKLEALRKAGLAANRLNHPVVFDPVGAGVSTLRKNAACCLLNELSFTVIRGNASEIRTLADDTFSCRGVDTDRNLSLNESAEVARRLADKTGAVVVLTGETDLVTDGHQTAMIRNGHPMMSRVSGTGCQLSTLIGAYVSAVPDEPFRSTLAAVCTMGLCGEIALSRMTQPDGNASYRNYIIDALFNLRGDTLEKGATYEIY